MADSFHDLIDCRDVSKTYISGNGPVYALGPTTFSVESGETIALVGPSGCGKTTLLLLMSGLEKPSNGSVRFRSQELTAPHREIGLVLQHYGLFPWKSVKENVQLGLRIRRESLHGNRVEELLSELELSDKVEFYPQQLSGGQRQRVALARALALNPKLLLLDEPFAALDTLTRERLQDLVAEMWRKRRFGMALVTHNIQEAVRLGRRILVMRVEPGHGGQVVAEVDNPSACEAAYRGSDEFHRKTLMVRERLELWA
ncbi:MAG: ATP-binding cassette domain-containing protein [Deltaproteobacteria bacterium]|nr:ATP-binding cassette domain-containing protein [Deltaproteobacteria bacterium]